MLYGHNWTRNAAMIELAIWPCLKQTCDWKNYVVMIEQAVCPWLCTLVWFFLGQGEGDKVPWSNIFNLNQLIRALNATGVTADVNIDPILFATVPLVMLCFLLLPFFFRPTGDTGIKHNVSAVCCQTRNIYVDHSIPHTNKGPLLWMFLCPRLS